MLGILVGGYLILTAVDRLWKGIALTSEVRGRISLALLFLFTGVGDFVKTEPMMQMLPEWVPSREGIVYVTGAIEFSAAFGLLVARFSQLTGKLLIAFLIFVFPANVYTAFEGDEMGGGDMEPAYLFIRTPVQLILIWWTYWFAVRRAKPRSTSIEHN
jgi:uncharacterized membrane protein